MSDNRGLLLRFYPRAFLPVFRDDEEPEHMNPSVLALELPIFIIYVSCRSYNILIFMNGKGFWGFGVLGFQFRGLESRV